MLRPRARRRPIFAGRLLLALALVFANGAWGQVLASALSDACPAMAAHFQHEHGGSTDSPGCCIEADRAVDCGRHGGAACTGACLVVCGLSAPFAASDATVTLDSTSASAPVFRSGPDSPSPAPSPALRPPISA